VVGGQSLVLTFDLEDWQQLARRRIGAANWDQPRPDLSRQVEAILALLEELGAKATFFVLGLTAERYPKVVERVATLGHEIASHGFNHLPLFSQTPQAVREDLRRSHQLLAELAGQPPLGYRAPAFSLTRDAEWTFELLGELGFRYDSSLHNSPRIPNRIPHPLWAHRRGEGDGIWELPIAVWPVRLFHLPVGGGSYWRFLPRRAVESGLRSVAGTGCCIYLHPYELDPEPLRLALPPRSPLAVRAKGVLRQLQRNPGKGKIPSLLRAVGHTFNLITCREAIEQLQPNQPTGPAPLQRPRSQL
jgi:polysaccharide deacetylase family protein (PEP-CTERM system associated)